MSIPDKLLLSDLLRHRVRCDQGIDHGPGLMVWMHPPVHRLLGWVSKPSLLNLSRNIWRLNQICAVSGDQIFVRGEPSFSEQSTLDRLPTLMDADVLNKKGKKIAIVADLIFHPKTGEILKYLLSRTDPRIPGTSRWSMKIESIIDQQPGMISVNINSLDDIPISKISIRQNILSRSKNFRDKVQEITDKATNKLEGWLEEPPWEEAEDSYNDFDDWRSNSYEKEKRSRSSNELNDSLYNEEDPWV